MIGYLSKYGDRLDIVSNSTHPIFSQTLCTLRLRSTFHQNIIAGSDKGFPMNERWRNTCAVTGDAATSTYMNKRHNTHSKGDKYKLLRTRAQQSIGNPLTAFIEIGGR